MIPTQSDEIAHLDRIISVFEQNGMECECVCGEENKIIFDRTKLTSNILSIIIKLAMIKIGSRPKRNRMNGEKKMKFYILSTHHTHSIIH